jgi:hypothetical protein
MIKPGTMLVSQPELPVPMVVQFPFPAWATRASEAGSVFGDTPHDDGSDGSARSNGHSAPADPFAGFPSA